MRLYTDAGGQQRSHIADQESQRLAPPPFAREFTQALRAGDQPRHSARSTQQRRYERTSNLIMTVMILFIAIEMPQCIFNMLMAYMGETYLANYTALEDVFEMLTVLYRWRARGKP